MNPNQQSSNDVQFKRMGFGDGLKQMSLELKVNFGIPAEFDFACVAKILTECIDLELAPIHTKILRQLTSDELIAQKYFWLVMLLTAKFLQSLKIPSVATGLITEITTIDVEKKTFQVTCQIPTVENFAASFITQSIGQAHRFISNISNPALTDLDLGSELDLLDERFIAPMGKNISGGKSTIALLKTAYQLGIPFMHIGDGIYQLGWGAQSHFLDRSMMDLDSAIGASIAHNKILAAKVLKQAGLPVPVHMLVKTMDEARLATEAIGFPVVVKPSDRDRGEGVTVWVDSIEKLGLAFDYACKASQNVLIERQIPGVCHRIMVINGQHVHTVARFPRSVQGDGVHTVKELCDLETQKEGRRAKHLRQSPFLFDELTKLSLSKQGMGYDSTPDQETLVFMRPIESTDWGGTPKLLSEDIHPENLRIALQAAQILGLKIAGIDLISDDIKKPWYENGGVINEVNFSPLFSLRLDYQQVSTKNALQILFKSYGRIPIEVYIGDHEALNAALLRQKQLNISGINCFMTTHLQSFDCTQEVKLALTQDGLFNRCRALLINRLMEALIIVIQTDEFLFTGLPVDSIDQVEVVNHNLTTSSSLNQSDKSNLTEGILALIEPYVKT